MSKSKSYFYNLSNTNEITPLYLLKEFIDYIFLLI